MNQTKVKTLENDVAHVVLAQRGRMTHISVSKLSIIESDNGLSPGRLQAIIRTNAGILWIRTLGTNFGLKRNSYIFIQENAFENVVCEMVSVSYRPQCVKKSCTLWRHDMETLSAFWL